MSYTEQLRAAQRAGLDRALENWHAHCDRIATEPWPEYDPDEEAADEEEDEP